MSREVRTMYSAAFADDELASAAAWEGPADEAEWLGEDQPEAFWPLVLRVMAVGARGAAPVFRAVGGRLGPAAARAVAWRLPGVFVRGTSRQVRAIARQVGGRLVGPERHGAGLPHYHLIRPGGDRIHIWFGRRVPAGDFFE
jgi:hypothetical protein